MTSTLSGTRSWEEAEEANLASTTSSMGSHSGGASIIEPVSHLEVFRMMFPSMFKEEWRESLEFARARNILLFPAMLALIAFVATIGLQFLVGEGAAQIAEDSNSFTWHEMRLALHGPLMLFSLGMGSFAFLGREVVQRRAGTRNHLLAAPALQPISTSITLFAYYLKDLTYYVLLIFSPILAGMAIGVAFEGLIGIPVALEWSSLPWTWFAMVITLAQGLALSFLGSALWLRGSAVARTLPLIGGGVLLLLGLGVVPVQTVMWGLLTQEQRVLGPLLLLPCIGLGALASTLVREDFEHRIQERRSLFEPLHAQLSFLGDGTLRVLVAKEFVDLRRSGALQKMTLSFTVPLLVLLGLAWLAEFAEWPIPVNLLSYAPFLGFFGFNFYSWLTGIDAPDHMNGLPVTVPQLIRAKVVVYFLSTTWISIAFLVLMAWQLDAWQALPVALIVMIANSIYIVALTAFLMGLRPNKAIFDASIMVWFWIGTVIPLLGLFLLSFTQGDTSFYQNWYDQVREGGLNATSAVLEDDLISTGFTGILAISGAIIIGGLILLRLLDKRWGKAPFEN